MTDSARRYTYKAGTAVLGGQDIINLDPFARDTFQATIHVDLVDGSMSAQPEYTMDAIGGDPLLLRWHPLGPVLTATTLTGIERAVTAVRLNVQAMTGEIRFTVIQGIFR